MKKITKESLNEAANRLMLELTDEELDILMNELSIIIKKMEEVGRLPGIEESEPMTFPFDVTNSFLREDDEVSELNKEDVLKNAKDVQDGQVKLPKVVK